MEFWIPIAAFAFLVPAASIAMIRVRAVRKERALGKRRKEKIHL